MIMDLFNNQNATLMRDDEKEFNRVYRDYLETSLIYKHLVEIVNGFHRDSDHHLMLSLGGGGGGGGVKSRESDEMEEKIFDTFWRAFLQSNCGSAASSSSSLSSSSNKQLRALATLEPISDIMSKNTSHGAMIGSELDSVVAANVDKETRDICGEAKLLLSRREQSYLVNKLESAFEKQLSEINEFMEPNEENLDEFTKSVLATTSSSSSSSSSSASSSSTNWFENSNTQHQQQQQQVGIDNDEEEERALRRKHSSSNKKLDVEQLLFKFNQLWSTVENQENLLESLNEKLSLKLDHCLHISRESLNLIRRLLSDYKLGFYVNENKIKCENQIVKCETVLAKISIVTNEIISDLYAQEKLKALSIVKNQINLETKSTKEKYDLLKLSLDEFRTLGKEFDDILSTYVGLKDQLSGKKWTLDKLNQDDLDIEIN